MKTPTPKITEPGWHIIDAKGKILGRMATEIATLLRGKNKPAYVPYLDCGDHVVVINAKSIVFTGNKLEDKTYYHHTGHPGGLRAVTAKELMGTKPDRVVISAVKGMLPKNKLQDEWMKRLHVYATAEHPHQANVANLAVN